jgi:hypothetical protein
MRRARGTHERAPTGILLRGGHHARHPTEVDASHTEADGLIIPVFELLDPTGPTIPGRACGATGCLARASEGA